MAIKESRQMRSVRTHTKKWSNRMKYLILLLISVNAFGFMSAAEARSKANVERIAREKQCVQDFTAQTEAIIDSAAKQGDSMADTFCYTCLAGLPAFAAKLRKFGYAVRISTTYQPYHGKFLHISW